MKNKIEKKVICQLSTTIQGVLTYTKYFLDVNRALEHWRYSFKLTTLRTCNNFMFFLLFFYGSIR